MCCRCYLSARLHCCNHVPAVISRQERGGRSWSHPSVVALINWLQVTVGWPMACRNWEATRCCMQSLGFSNVTTTVRMTVIKLASGGLWVHAPVAPTTECLFLLRELDAPVEHIILPTFAYEHKVGGWGLLYCSGAATAGLGLGRQHAGGGPACCCLCGLAPRGLTSCKCLPAQGLPGNPSLQIFCGPFSRRFPKAKVYVAPSQWSWPINLPVQVRPPTLGVFGICPIVCPTTPPLSGPLAILLACAGLRHFPRRYPQRQRCQHSLGQ